MPSVPGPGRPKGSPTIGPPSGPRKVKSKGGRVMGYRHQDDVRQKIQASTLVRFLQKHVAGEYPGCDASRVTAALGLLKKILPDLSAVELAGNVTLTHEQQLEQLR